MIQEKQVNNPDMRGLRVDDVQLARLEATIAYTFQRRELLVEALAHRSILRECAQINNAAAAGLTGAGAGASVNRNAATEHTEGVLRFGNERLEFLGDAVLGLAMGSLLFKRTAALAEGELSRMRSALVNETYLSSIARKIDLGDALLMGRAEQVAGGRERNSILADAFEALLGAVYLDGGFEAAAVLIERLFSEELAGSLNRFDLRDYKTELQEFVQAKFRERPDYQVVQETGPCHAREFEVRVMIQGKEFGRGFGPSKKAAAQSAAEVALSKWLGTRNELQTKTPLKQAKNLRKQKSSEDHASEKALKKVQEAGQ